MNTQSWPSRGSTASAVRTGEARSRPARPARIGTLRHASGASGGALAALVPRSASAAAGSVGDARIGQGAALGERIGRHRMRIVGRRRA